MWPCRYSIIPIDIKNTVRQIIKNNMLLNFNNLLILLVSLTLYSY